MGVQPANHRRTDSGLTRSQTTPFLTVAAEGVISLGFSVVTVELDNEFDERLIKGTGPHRDVSDRDAFFRLPDDISGPVGITRQIRCAG